MHPSEVNRIRNEIRRLVLAAADMKLVCEGARALAESNYLLNARLIEVGLVVTYCRASADRPGRTLSREPRLTNSHRRTISTARSSRFGASCTPTRTTTTSTAAKPATCSASTRTPRNTGR